MIFFKDWNDELVASAGLDTKCPQKPIELIHVYEDFQKPGKQQQGYRHCFCLAWYQANGTDISGTLEEFKKVDPGLAENPCEDWKYSYENAFYLTIITGACVGLINTIVCLIFELVAPLEKCRTWTDEYRGIFERITVIQFLNVGALFIVSDFSLGFERGEKAEKFPILVGKHRDFDPAWFYDVGAKITMALLMNSFVPHFGRMAEPFVQRLGLRWVLDRWFKKHLRKKSNMEGDEGKGASKK